MNLRLRVGMLLAATLLAGFDGGCIPPCKSPRIVGPQRSYLSIVQLTVSLARDQARLAGVQAQHGAEHAKHQELLARIRVYKRHLRALRKLGYRVHPCLLAAGLAVAAARAQASLVALQTRFHAAHPAVKVQHREAQVLTARAQRAQIRCPFP